MTTADFYEDDEPVEKIAAAFDNGEKGYTYPLYHHCECIACQAKRGHLLTYSTGTAATQFVVTFGSDTKPKP